MVATSSTPPPASRPPADRVARERAAAGGALARRSPPDSRWQLVLAWLMLELPFAKAALAALNQACSPSSGRPGRHSLVFGYLGGGKEPFAVSDPASSFILAFRALPLVLVISALSALLFYWRVLPAIVAASRGCSSGSWGRRRRGLSTAANVFVGMVRRRCS